MEWIDVAQCRNRWQKLVNAVMNIWVIQYARNLFTRWGTVSFSGKTLLHGVS